MKFISYTYPGLELILKKEIESRKVNVLDVGPGFVKFDGDQSTMVKMNLWLRTANKVYLILKEDNVNNFNELFNSVYSINWKYYIPNKYSFNLKVRTNKSKLSSIRSIQSISQKAIIKSLVGESNYLFFDDKLEIRIDIYKDRMLLLLDTSGEPLYKRGYKKDVSKAGIKETLAAGLLFLLGCKCREFYDLFTGSGTLIIEKVLIDKNIAPGIYRNFIFEKFSWFDLNLLNKEKWRASTRIKEIDNIYYAYDIDNTILNTAILNAKQANLYSYIKFKNKNYLDLDLSNKCFIANPPYDLRLKLDNINKIYLKLYKDMLKSRCSGVITAYKEIPKEFYDSFKNRVLSNGGILTNFFSKKYGN